MLRDLMVPGAKLLGLSSLINIPRQGFDGCYRVQKIVGGNAIEFFEASTRKDVAKMQHVKILTYRPGKISQVPVGGGEVISGEFTGCVMSLFTKDGILSAAHVDTNSDTSQRDAYTDMLKKAGVNMVAEYDTAGQLMMYPGIGPTTVILCLANTNSITHYFVSKSAHQFSSFQSGPGDPEEKWRLTPETMYTVLDSMGQ